MILLHPVYIIIHLVYYYNNANEELLKNVKSNQKKIFRKKRPQNIEPQIGKENEIDKKGFL